MNRTQKEYSGEIPVTEKIEAAKAVMAREKSQSALAAEYGVSRQAVHQWVQLYRVGELHLGRSGRGRPKIRNLTAAEGKKIKSIILGKTPQEAGIGSQFKRWDYEATRRLIRRETGVKMTYRIVADHMERWGLPHGPNIPVIDERAAMTPEVAEQSQVEEPEAPTRAELLPEFPRRRRGRPRKLKEPAQKAELAADAAEEVDVEDADDYIDYQAEVEKSRQFLQNLKHGTGLGKHARQRRAPFQKKKKKRKK